MEFITDVLASEAFSQAMTGIFLTFLTGVITSVGAWVTMFLKSKLNANQLELLDQIAANVVLAVEQSLKGTNFESQAEAKKAAAMTILTEYLKKYNINVSPELLDATIEAAVANVLNANKLIEPPRLVDVEGPRDGSFM